MCPGLKAGILNSVEWLKGHASRVLVLPRSFIHGVGHPQGYPLVFAVKPKNGHSLCDEGVAAIHSLDLPAKTKKLRAPAEFPTAVFR